MNYILKVDRHFIFHILKVLSMRIQWLGLVMYNYSIVF